jgi:nuclear pore complex protein Nup88
MAQWWEVLSRVDIFRDFLKDGKSEGSGLLTSTESDLLLWVEERKCVLAINLRKLHMQLQNEDVDAVEWPEVFYQLLLCSKEPFYTVHRIQVSPKGESLLLEGISNLMVMKMLKRRGLRGEYGGGHKEVVCATLVVEVYAENQSNIIRRMEWLNEKEFIVLSSDNVLRKFSTTLPTQPVLSIGLSETVASFPSVSAPGLDWIDFSILDHSTLVCLRDSGEVQILRLNNPNGVELSDALPMFPSAQDNYTSDASVLLVLQTALPIVVIATPTGEMHHCIMLPKTESSGVPTECLVVYERLHLESDVVHDYGAIQLLPDPTSPNGYFIQHQLGVHRVLLPWAERMNMFMSSEDCSNVSPVEGQADIQYLLDVATSDTDLTRTPALCGVSVTWDTIIGNSLVCIASDGTCVVFLLQ